MYYSCTLCTYIFLYHSINKATSSAKVRSKIRRAYNKERSSQQTPFKNRRTKF